MSDGRDRATKRTMRATPRSEGLPSMRTVQARVDSMVEHRAALEHALAVMLTEQRIVVIALVYDRPLSTADLAFAVRAWEPSPLFDQFERLRHRNAAYRVLYDLGKRRVLTRGMRDETLVFGLRRRVRAEVGAVLTPTARSRESAHSRQPIASNGVR